MIDDQKQPEKTSDYSEETSSLSEQVELEEAVAPDGEFAGQDNSAAEEVMSESVVSSEADNSTETIQSLQQEIESLKTQLEQHQQQSESFKNQYLRTAADFDNFRRRTQKEKEDLEQLIKRNTINELLPTVDNFERARAQIKPQNDGEMNIHKSYQGVYKQLVDSLKRIGVSAMRPEGQEFDPNLHEAVMREPTNEHPEGTVIEQLVRGYMLGDRVLRHAMVKVAAPGEPVVDSEEAEPLPENQEAG